MGELKRAIAFLCLTIFALDIGNSGALAARAKGGCLPAPDHKWVHIAAPQFPDHKGRPDHAPPLGALDYQVIRGIEVNPTDPSLIFIHNGKTVMRSTDGGCSWKQVFDVYDEEVLPDGATDGSNITGVVSVPGSNRVFVLLWSVNYPVRVSDDGGDTWTTPQGLPLWSGNRGPRLEISRAHPDLMYLAVHDGDQSFSFYASDDGGKSWGLRGEIPLDESSQSGNVQALFPNFSFTIDPLREETIWAADDFGLLSSEDGGRTWSRDKRVVPNSVDAVADGSTSIVGGLTWWSGVGKEHIQFSVDAGKNWTSVPIPEHAKRFAFGETSQSVALLANEVDEGNRFKRSLIYRFDARARLWNDITPPWDPTLVPQNDAPIDTDETSHPGIYVCYTNAILKYVGRW